MKKKKIYVSKNKKILLEFSKKEKEEDKIKKILKKWEELKSSE